MDYKLINDYELIYLIKEGNETAYLLLFKKYELYLWKIAKDFIGYNEKMEDLVQEGRILMNTCIYAYKSDLGISFFSFVTLCLRREYAKQMAKNYFDEYLTFNESIHGGGYDHSLDIVYKSDAFLDNEEDKEMYQFVILDGLSLKLYARKKHLSYHKVYYQYALLVEKMKKKIVL